MDQQIFYAINGWANRSQFFDRIGIFAAETLIYVFVGIIIGAWLYRRSLKHHLWIAFWSALIARGLIVEGLKRLVNRPRPFEVLHGVHKLLVDEGSGKSFPSGHAVLFFSIAFAFYGTKWFWPFFIIACVGSFARIFVGVHYPSDVLAGAVIGALTSLILLRLSKRHVLS